MVAPLNLVWWTLPIELSFYLLLPLLGWCAGFINWRVLLLSSLLITLVWRFLIFSMAEVDNYVAILPVLDSLPGTLFTFMLGFSLNFLPDALTVEQRRKGIIIGLLLLMAIMKPYNEFIINLEYKFDFAHQDLQYLASLCHLHLKKQEASFLNQHLEVYQ